MPYARISLLKGRPPAYLRTLSGQLHHALADAFEVPPDHCVQVIHQPEPAELLFDRH